MSSPARARDSVRYLPIDGLMASLDDALEEIGEIESRRGDGHHLPPQAAQLEQEQRLRDAKDFIDRALQLALDYSKGPSA